MSLRERIKGAITGWKAATLSTGEAPPLPNAYGSAPYLTDFGALWYLRTGDQTIDPRDANEGRDNSIVSLCIGYIATSWAVTIPQVGVENGEEFHPDPSPHPFLDIWNKPNDSYDREALTWGLISDFCYKGNAYLHATKTRRGEIVKLSWLPARYVRPMPDKMGQLLYYEYSPNGEMLPIKPADVAHIRYGMDEQNPLLGVTPLGAQYREIVTDNGYSNYAGGLANGGGVPPITFSPKTVKGPDGEDRVTMSKEQAKVMSERMQEKMQREPGKPMFVPGALDMHQMAFKPDDMALLETRAMPETRIPASLGLNPLVLQLYTGLTKSNYNNMKEAIKQSWRGGIIPMMRIFAGPISTKFVQAYPGSDGKRFRWDTSPVEELKRDLIAERQEDREDVKAGIMLVEEARADQGRMTDTATLARLAEQRPAPPDMGQNDDPESGKGGPPMKAGRFLHYP